MSEAEADPNEVLLWMETSGSMRGLSSLASAAATSIASLLEASDLRN